MQQSIITSQILKAAYLVHSNLGPGLLESAYEACLYYELLTTGFIVERQVPMPLIYKEVKLETGYRIDILVERSIVIEVKAVETFTDVHIAQMITYLKLSNCKVGLLINFHVNSLKNGIKRVVY
ncbi:GxxExxY protein [Sediminibacterium sp.]|uniref:GxxExxY protein n=1 Tax=Sediminibacterium sp. TaxID=1917865 RepID=UPI0025D85C9A|nr:GxxExxY protein [Sediminibacterium sp.]MBW0178368.1 GxxExxY protein [Sediminibacterium sp.]